MSASLADVATLLMLIKQYDNRDFDDAKVIAWHALLDDLEPADCASAVREHFKTSESYLMPVHVRSGALRAAKRRDWANSVAAGRAATPVAELPPPPVAIEDGPAPRPEWKTGTDARSAEATKMIATLRQMLPASRGNPNWSDPALRPRRAPRAADREPSSLGDIMNGMRKASE